MILFLVRLPRIMAKYDRLFFLSATRRFVGYICTVFEEKQYTRVL